MFIGRLICLFASATAAFAAVAAPRAENTDAAEATTVFGTLNASSSSFTAGFTVDGIPRFFRGSGFPQTTATTSILSFANDNQLGGVQNYTGIVDITTVTVNLFEGATISWTQDPNVSARVVVLGSGLWF